MSKDKTNELLTTISKLISRMSDRELLEYIAWRVAVTDATDEESLELLAKQLESFGDS